MGRPIDEDSVIDIVAYECGEWAGLAKEIEKQIRALPTCNQLTTDCISRQAAMNAFAERVKRSNNSDFAPVPRWNDAVEIVENLPSVDAVEVVRCKDCKHRILNKYFDNARKAGLKYYCDLDTGDPYELGRNAEDDNWFCADAERRQDG